jgi:serine/threonine-protein kinase
MSDRGEVRDLWSLIGTPVEPAHAIGIVIAACKALARADLRGGLTPSRVLVSSSGEVTIGAPDFSANILGYVAPELGEASASTVRLPSGGTLIFPTPSFESDEWRAAVFALGCMLWELLAGRRLFVGTTDYETMMLARAAAVPPIPGVAAELEAIVRRALAKDVESRYQTPMQLAEALARYLG